MKSIIEKFIVVAKKFRLVENKKWHKRCEEDLLKSLDRIEFEQFKEFYAEMTSKLYFEKVDDDYLLTKEGEILVYGDEDNLFEMILDELHKYGASEGYCWQFGSWNSFEARLNAHEEKLFNLTIDKMIKNKLFALEPHNKNLIVTKVCEQIIKERYYK